MKWRKDYHNSGGRASTGGRTDAAPSLTLRQVTNYKDNKTTYNLSRGRSSVDSPVLSSRRTRERDEAPCRKRLGAGHDKAVSLAPLLDREFSEDRLSIIACDRWYHGMARVARREAGGANDRMIQG